MTPQDRAELFIKRLVKPFFKSQPLEGDEVPRIEPDPKDYKRPVKTSTGEIKVEKIKKNRARSREVYKSRNMGNRHSYRQTRKPFVYDDPDPNEY